MGLNSELFIEKVDPEFICTICQDVFDDPVSLVECEHLFCRCCFHSIQAQADDTKQCPLCNTAIKSEPKAPHRLVLNFWNKLKLKCEFTSGGCTAVITAEENSNHVRVCDFNPKNQACQNCGDESRGSHDCLSHLKMELKRCQDRLNMELKNKGRQIYELKGELWKYQKSQHETSGFHAGPPNIIRNVFGVQNLKSYQWGPWRIMKGEIRDPHLGELFYIWTGYIILQVGNESKGKIRFLVNSECGTMSPDGTRKKKFTTTLFNKYFTDITLATPLWNDHNLLNEGDFQLLCGSWMFVVNEGTLRLYNTFDPRISMTFDNHASFSYSDVCGRKVIFTGSYVWSGNHVLQPDGGSIPSAAIIPGTPSCPTLEPGTSHTPSATVLNSQANPSGTGNSFLPGSFSVPSDSLFSFCTPGAKSS